MVSYASAPESNKDSFLILIGNLISWIQKLFYNSKSSVYGDNKDVLSETNIFEKWLSKTDELVLFYNWRILYGRLLF